jgi:ATP-dependent DNA ligase
MQLPVMPPLDPMLARSVSGVPQSDSVDGGLGYEPKWDGFRCLVFRDGDEVELASRNGRPITRYFPELVAGLRAELPGKCVLDGEVVVATEGRLQFELLQQRIHPAASRVKMLAEQIPARFVAFDLLALAEESLLDHPFADRRKRLEQTLPDAGSAMPSDAAPAATPAAASDRSGRSAYLTPICYDHDTAVEWFNSFEGAGLDGIVAKPLTGPYQPGKRAMIKIKHERTADCVLAGYRLHKTSTPARPLLGSLLLGLYDDAGHLQFVGVSASFPTARRAALVGELAPLVAGDAEHPWADWQDPTSGRRPGAESRWSSGKDLSFTPLRPERVLEVAYDHMEGTRFRHTAPFRRWRDDRDPASCTFAQLEEPVGYDLAQILPGA